MRKLVIVLMVIMSLAIFVGCGGTSANNESSGQTEGEKCASLIPEPSDYFTNADITTELEDRCYYYVTNYQDGEYDAYIQAVKDKGDFPTIQSERSSDTGKTFMAYTSNKSYILKIFFSYDNQGITISCNKVKESSSTE